MNKKLLQIKLRDFPKTEGLRVGEFIFLNTVKAAKKPVQSTIPSIVPGQGTAKPKSTNQNPVTTQNQLPNQKSILQN